MPRRGTDSDADATATAKEKVEYADFSIEVRGRNFGLLSEASRPVLTLAVTVGVRSREEGEEVTMALGHAASGLLRDLNILHRVPEIREEP